MVAAYVDLDSTGHMSLRTVNVPDLDVIHRMMLVLAPF